MIIETVTDLITSTPANGMIVYTVGNRVMGAKSTVNSIEEAMLQVDAFWRYEQSKQFVWGDFINDCALKFGEAAAQIIPITNNAPATLANWSAICSQYTHHQRLHDVSFSHYAAIAYLTDHDRRDELLAWAARTGVSVEVLKIEAGIKTPKTADNGLNLNEGCHAIVLDVDTVNQVRLGNLRSLASLFKQWRGVMQPGKQYRVVLQEVND
jgi:hypothetical protein